MIQLKIVIFKQDWICAKDLKSLKKFQQSDYRIFRLLQKILYYLEFVQNILY